MTLAGSDEHSRRVDWEVLDRAYDATARASSSLKPEFVANRLNEGKAIAAFLASRSGGSQPLQVLDLGAGNGGVTLGVANHALFRVASVDTTLNRDLRLLRKSTGIPVLQVLASGEALPFAPGSFDVVLCLETIEHVLDARRVGSEIMRVLKPGGFCMLTTPARFRHLLGRDPHFGLIGLLLLPDRLQRWLVTRVLRIVSEIEYNVSHVYWYAGSIARLFPDRQEFQALSAAPPSRFRSFLQRFVWSRFLVVKAGGPVPNRSNPGSSVERCR